MRLIAIILFAISISSSWLVCVCDNFVGSFGEGDGVHFERLGGVVKVVIIAYQKKLLKITISAPKNQITV